MIMSTSNVTAMKMQRFYSSIETLGLSEYSKMGLEEKIWLADLAPAEYTDQRFTLDEEGMVD